MENRPRQPQGFVTEQDRIADQARDTARDVGDKAEGVIDQATNKAREIADDLRSKDAGQIASDAKAKASEVASDAKAKASEVATVAADKAESAVTATGTKMTDLAQTVRENAPEGKAGEIAMNAANTLDRGGTYLQESNLNDIRGDLETVIRNHPIESMLVGLGVGYLLARSMRR